MGLVLLVVWVAALQIMLDKGKDLDWFSSTTIVTLAVIAVVTFVFFVIWELTDKHPVIDLTLFKELNFTSDTITLSRSEEHTSELQSLMRNSYAVFCLKKKTIKLINKSINITSQRNI